MTYLKDGKYFIHASERTGFKHLYLYTTEGKLVNQITSGDWEVSSVEGVDESGKKPIIYFTSTEKSPLERQFYSIATNGKNKKTIRGEAGWHSIDMGGDLSYYIDSHSSQKHPRKVSLYKTANNSLVKVLEDNAKLVQTVKDYDLVEKEFFSFTNSENVVLNGYMLKPSDFTESKEYPVLVFQYSGPGSQQVMNNWGGGSNFYWHQMLTQKGYIIAVIDPRGTGARGEEFKKNNLQRAGQI